jgi:hypothetical protein
LESLLIDVVDDEGRGVRRSAFRHDVDEIEKC